MEKRKNNWSILGFGCMRFPVKSGRINMKETERELAYAIRHGINYFDTAYVYRGSEKALGTLLAKNQWREKVVIATKLPHYLIHSVEGAQKIFAEQLARLQTDYIDNYLMHMLPDVHVWENMVHMGILDWLLEMKAAGKIRKIGFSYHGNTCQFIEILDAYAWDFCQVQYNYMDEHSQAGREGMEYAAKKGFRSLLWNRSGAAGWSMAFRREQRKFSGVQIQNAARRSGLCVGYGTSPAYPLFYPE